MASLTYPEKKLLEELFGMDTGYVLDFTDRTFSGFFKDFNINIDAAKYHQPYGSSKAKRMRSFWDQESDLIVGRVLESVFQLMDGPEITQSHRAITNRLLGTDQKKQETVDQFLEKEFGEIDLKPLKLESAMEETIKRRMGEIRICIKSGAWLSSIILSGSSMEGVLLDVAVKNPKEFNQSKAAPKDGAKVVKKFQEWSLSDLINVAYDLSLIGLDVKKFGHALRDFRNFIHPYEQTVYKFSPDHHTAKISWQVLQAALADLSGKRKSNS